MFDELWSEIADSQGEIFDISDDDKEEMAKVFAMSEEEYYEYWNPEQFAHWFYIFCIKYSAFPTMNLNTLELLIADCFEYINDNDTKAGKYWSDQLFTSQGDIKRHMISEMTLQRLERIAADLYDRQEA